MSAIPGTWTAEELMHGKDDHHDAAAAAVVAGGVASLAISSPNGSPMSKSPTKRFTMSKMGKKKPPSDPMDWGMPGHLTEGEVAIFVSCSYLFVFLSPPTTLLLPCFSIVFVCVCVCVWQGDDDVLWPTTIARISWISSSSFVVSSLL
jgi:hypothetical protein